VEYAWKFKAMHELEDGSKNLFFQISPYQGLTGANADHWMACKPGSESTIALGLVRQALDIGKGKFLPKSFQEFLDRTTAPYSQDVVLERSGIPLALYEKLIIQMMGARRPLVLGTGTGASDLNGLQTNLAANLLNLLLDPNLTLIDFTNRHRVELAARRIEILQFFDSVKNDQADLLLLNNVNPVFSLPADSQVAETLGSSNTFVVCFSNFMDDTAELADLVLPVQMPLESWDEYGGKHLLASTLQPAMGKMTKASNLGDVMLYAGFDGNAPAKSYKDYLISDLAERRGIADEIQWVGTLQQGGNFDLTVKPAKNRKKPRSRDLAAILSNKPEPLHSQRCRPSDFSTDGVPTNPGCVKFRIPCPVSPGKLRFT
jgi:molybdopterin-containing oxidoreductase family iron-sulfur binding subunit